MAIQRTARGTATDKTGALTLTVSNVQLARRLLIVGIAYDVGQGDPVVTWGNRTLTRISGANANGINCAIYAFRRRRPAKTKNVVATWTGSAPTAKAMFVSTYSEVEIADFFKSNTQAATATPNAGTAQTTAVADEALVAAMGSEGPQGDAAGTPSNSWTAGQRAGTVGAPAAGNITIQEIYKITTATESAQAALTGVTNRDWSCTITTWKIGNDKRFNFIYPYDWEETETIFDNAELDEDKAVLYYNKLLGRNEVYEVDLVNNGTLRGHWDDDDTNDWITD